MNKLTIILTFAVLALAQTPAPHPPPKPAITDAQRASFWRAVHEKSAADEKYQASLTEMQSTCTAGGQILGLDQKGEPQCSAPQKPAEAPKPEPAKK